MTAPDGLPAEVLAYVSGLASALDAACPGPTGVYLHGSAALGGFRPAGSDVDVLAVVAGPMPRGEQKALGARLAAVPGCPGVGLEMSVITAPTTAAWREGRFQVHVNTTESEPTVVPGGRHGRDPDLILHCAVCRERAVAVTGPPPAEVFDRVPRRVVLAAMVADLQWAKRRAPTRYAVLNACRAKRYADEGLLVSKVDGGEWFLGRHGPHPVVAAALDAQRHGGAEPDRAAARRFVREIRGYLDKHM
jgi:streptomycin 3"-adenylyltransferase